MNINQKRKIKEIAIKHNLKLIILFGSFATGKIHANSDMDIAIIEKSNINLEAELKIIRELSEIFNQKIDLSVINRANPLLFEQISRNGVLLYGNAKEFMKFKLYAFHRYNDYQPFFKMEAEFIKNQIKK